MRDGRGTTAFEDTTLLLVAAVAFSLFLASVVSAYVAFEARARGARLTGDADAFLASVMHDPRWTRGRGVFLAEALNETDTEDLRPLAAARPFLLVVWDLTTDWRWTFGGEGDGDRRTAITSANVVARGVDPARIVATVWGA